MRKNSGSKYHRQLISLEGHKVSVDVYRVLEAFNVTNPGIQHAIKKLLCAGIRGKGDLNQDLAEAKDAITAAEVSIFQRCKLGSPEIEGCCLQTGNSKIIKDESRNA